MPEKEMQELITMMIHDDCCRVEGRVIAASRFHVTFTAEQKKSRQKLEQALETSGYTPMKTDELLAMDKQAKAVLDAMKDDTVLFLTAEYVISKKWYDQAVAAITTYFKGNPTITLSDFRDLLQSNRKASLLLLDYMDTQHVTKRLENHRTAGEALKEALS
jgi:selenocysteine-specific elongation factor